MRGEEKGLVGGVSLKGMRKSINEQLMMSIKAWAEDDRPREKMISKGRHVLSDAELIATLIRSGTRNETAVELAMRLLQRAGSIEELARLSVNELTRVKGIGQAKASSIVAALELGRRRNDAAAARVRLCGSEEIYAYVRAFLGDLPHEEFWVLLLNKANYVIGRELISKGGVDSTVVDTKVIFKAAIDRRASGLVLCHNHPSGNFRPSHQDMFLTRRVIECAHLFAIEVIDHIIFSDTGYFSFSDNGKL